VNGNLTPAAQTHHALDPWRRTDYVRDMIDAAVFIATHLGVPCPCRITAELEVHGDDDDEREQDILMTAAALGVVIAVEVVDDEGWLCASRQFGPVTLQARTPARKAQAA
jgi:hypothetical protein